MQISNVFFSKKLDDARYNSCLPMRGTSKKKNLARTRSGIISAPTLVEEIAFVFSRFLKIKKFKIFKILFSVTPESSYLTQP